MNAYTASIFVGVTRFVMSLMNAWLLRRFKRRPLIMVSSLGMAACMFVSGLVTYWIKQGMVDFDQMKSLEINSQFFCTFRSNGHRMGKCCYNSCSFNGLIYLLYLGPSRLPAVICLHVYDRVVNNTLDNDS